MGINYSIDLVGVHPPFECVDLQYNDFRKTNTFTSLASHPEVIISSSQYGEWLPAFTSSLTSSTGEKGSMCLDAMHDHSQEELPRGHSCSSCPADEECDGDMIDDRHGCKMRCDSLECHPSECNHPRLQSFDSFYSCNSYQSADSSNKVMKDCCIVLQMLDIILHIQGNYSK